MATQESIEKAAQAWCKPTTGHLVMEPDLAYVFAEMLDELKAEIEQLHYAADVAIGEYYWCSICDKMKTVKWEGR